jgi:hypothetical protein
MISILDHQYSPIIFLFIILQLILVSAVFILQISLKQQVKLMGDKITEHYKLIISKYFNNVSIALVLVEELSGLITSIRENFKEKSLTEAIAEKIQSEIEIKLETLRNHYCENLVIYNQYVHNEYEKFVSAVDVLLAQLSSYIENSEVIDLSEASANAFESISELNRKFIKQGEYNG